MSEQIVRLFLEYGPYGLFQGSALYFVFVVFGIYRQQRKSGWRLITLFVVGFVFAQTLALLALLT